MAVLTNSVIGDSHGSMEEMKGEVAETDTSSECLGDVEQRVR